MTTPRKPKVKPEPVRVEPNPLPGNQLEPLYDELARRAVQVGYEKFQERVAALETLVRDHDDALLHLPETAAPGKPFYASKKFLAMAGGVLAVLSQILMGDRLPSESLPVIGGIVMSYVLSEAGVDVARAKK